MAYISEKTGRKVDGLLDFVEQVQKEGLPKNAVLYRTTYSELVKLRDNAELIEGAYYRITDYQCTTIQEDSRSAGHQFDIIVQALDESTLSENAQAVSREGDEYFANANLNAWRLKYSLDNDVDRFAWAQKHIDEQPAQWSCEWGVLEEKYDNGASTVQPTIVNGVEKFLYRPSNPTSFLEGKEFYYVAGREVLDVAIAEDLIFVTEKSPYDDAYDTESLLIFDRPSGKFLTSLYEDSNYGETETGDYDDDGNPIVAYNVYFLDNVSSQTFDMYFYGHTIEIDGKTYYEWFPYNHDYYDIQWWLDEYANPFVINEGERIVYNGAIGNLSYALDSALAEGEIYVYEVTDGNHIYICAENADGSPQWFDIVKYSPYVAPQEEGYGVVYRMIDEHENDCPYDFKNMQFLHDGQWYYTFSYLGNDLSITDYCGGNYIQPCVEGANLESAIQRTLPNVIFDLAQNYKAQGVFYNSLEVGVRRGYISAYTITKNIWSGSKYDNIVEELYLKAKNLIYNNVIRGIVSKFIVGKNSTMNAFFGNDITLPQINYYVVSSISYPTVITIDGTQCSYNVFNLRHSSRGFAFNGTFLDNYIEDLGVAYEGGIPLADVKTYLSESRILLNSKLTIQYDNTTSSTAPLRFLNIDARGWGDTTLTIPTTFPTNANYELKVAKNSAGEIKMWCDADLVPDKQE